MDKVYIVIGYVDYEGDSVVRVFREESDAKEFIENFYDGYWEDDFYILTDNGRVRKYFDGMYITMEEVL